MHENERQDQHEFAVDLDSDTIRFAKDFGFTDLGEGLFRVDVSGGLAADILDFGDVVELKEETDETLVFIRKVRESPYRRWGCIVPRDFDWQILDEYWQRVVNAGGYGERLLDGLLLFYLPPESSLNPGTDLNDLLG
ncbi:MAG: hypothetical protein HY319_15150 [Armatimonadetes bacterium]|nr:hypothetical protein [Armatimonadota bacterium]